MTLLKSPKEAIERLTGCRIYRGTLPHGADCFVDIDRRFGRRAVRVAFDVGANIGQTALCYAREFPSAEIYSFEPVAASFEKLAAATRQVARIHPCKLGMGSEAGEATIHVNPTSTMSSIKISRPEDHSEVIAIETVTGFAQAHKIESIDLLKIDTEGYDLEVLAGAAPLLGRQRIHFVLSECGPAARSDRFVGFGALSGFMENFGYRLFGIYGQQPEWDGRNQLLFWNALFICEKLVARGARLA